MGQTVPSEPAEQDKRSDLVLVLVAVGNHIRIIVLSARHMERREKDLFRIAKAIGLQCDRDVIRAHFP